MWRTRKSLWGAPFVAALALAVAGCGGSSGSDADGASGPSTAGRVALLATDASADDFASILLTVEKVELLSQDLGPHTLWQGSEEVDLLALSDHSELFAVADDVPAGPYDKIRLHVADDSLTLIPKDPGKEANYRLPGSKLDLNPRGRFEVTAGETLYIQLDFDAAKTLAFSNVPKGHREEGIFRPVVFVTILGADSGTGEHSGALTRIRGEIQSADAESFVLCHPTVANADYCATVAVSADTSVFKDVGGTLVAASVLAEDAGQRAVAYGHLDIVADRLEAVVVQIGDTFLERPLRGDIVSVDDGAGTLSFDLDGDAVTVDYHLARLFRCDGTQLSPEDLALLPLPANARVDGLDDGETDVMQATIVIVKVCEDAEERAGTITGEPVEFEAHVRMEVEGPPPEKIAYCARFSLGTTILREADTSNGSGPYELAPVDLGDLGSGHTMRLFGWPGEGQKEGQGNGECFDGSSAIIVAPSEI